MDGVGQREKESKKQLAAGTHACADRLLLAAMAMMTTASFTSF
jgi:hypothetical protein